ncbi:sugar transferase [Microbacterium sp. Marseille-Q6965]|uniref:sugar transferase n=1 Tax=Microbacterium sp. Marseille-Q6965 TaxID=2965072 RepID=UPI0037C96BA7
MHAMYSGAAPEEFAPLEAVASPAPLAPAPPSADLRVVQGPPPAAMPPLLRDDRRLQNALKRGIDLALALTLILALSPLMTALALVVKASSPGPVLFRQERVGHMGKTFLMLKFRSMVADAEERLDEVRALQDTGNVVMFKLRDDPRVTRAGAVMRRYSLDELPQLFNVLAGDMSLVGPRPPLPREVAEYEPHVHRRFLVRPGITGLWQVSGRSTLSWEETVRLDLSYVESWSLSGDLGLLLRTVKVVVAPGDTVA